MTGRYQLFIGDGPHGCCLGDAGVQLQFFDHWLKGLDTGVNDSATTPMHLQEIGTTRYVNLATYPWTTTYTPLRLGPGTLTSKVPDKTGSDQLVWGPTSDGTTALSYTSQPFAGGASIAGPMSATVYASSSNTNLQLSLTLFDVDQTGKATEITHGSLLGSLSDLDTSRSWTTMNGVVYRPYPLFDWDRYKPMDTVVRYDVALAPKLYPVAAGHSIRLRVSTQADTQTCAAAANIGPPPLGCLYTAPQATTLPGGVYQLERNRTYPTALNLPLLPANVFPAERSGTTPTSGGEIVPLDWGG